MIHYTKNEPYGQPPYYTAVTECGCVLGTLMMEVDGLYYLQPSVVWKNGGFVPGWHLLDLGKKLESLNEAWNQKVAEAVSTKIQEACTEWTPKFPPKP